MAQLRPPTKTWMKKIERSEGGRREEAIEKKKREQRRMAKAAAAASMPFPSSLSPSPARPCAHLGRPRRRHGVRDRREDVSAALEEGEKKKRRSWRARSLLLEREGGASQRASEFFFFEKNEKTRRRLSLFLLLAQKASNVAWEPSPGLCDLFSLSAGAQPFNTPRDSC